jgi:hypothetical protein
MLTRRIDTSGARSETIIIINGMRYLKLQHINFWLVILFVKEKYIVIL